MIVDRQVYLVQLLVAAGALCVLAPGTGQVAAPILLSKFYCQALCAHERAVEVLDGRLCFCYRTETNKAKLP